MQGVSGYLLISGSLLEPDKLSLALVRSAGNSPSQTDPLLLSLASFTTGDLLQSLADAVQWVSRFSDGEMLRAQLPIVDATFGSVLDAGNFFEQRIMAAFEDENGVPLFSNLDEFLARFATVSGLSPVVFNYNAATNSLLLNLTLNAGLTGTTDEINFDLVLPPLTNFATSSTATIGGSANIGLNITIGMTNAVISQIALKPMA